MKESPLELSTRPVHPNGSSAFGQSKVFQAIAGDIAEPYAHFLNDKGYKSCFVYTLTPQSLEQLGVKEDNAEVRAVGLGNYDGIYNLVASDRFNYGVAAYDQFSDDGRARGVVHVGAQKEVK